MAKTKRCSKCKEVKPLEDFYKDERKKDGVRYGCKTCCCRDNKKYRHTLRGKEAVRKTQLKLLFGITPQDYDRIYDNQKGCCAICGVHQFELKRKLDLDHDHETKTIRGLLCGNCNRGIGNLKDSPVLLRRAADYLENR